MIIPNASVPKEHHFVPKFYLRRFSKNGKQVHAFNFSRNCVIANASIKGQCSRRNFHGFAPGLEEALGKLEGAASQVMREIGELGRAPPRDSVPWHALLTYIAFQKVRTGRSASVSGMLSDYYDSLMHEGAPPDAETQAHIESIRKYPVAIPISVAPDIVPLVERLHMHLLINRTQRPFITSDDPVVTHNRFCEGILNRGTNGWGQAGVQILLPLDARRCILLFDNEIYSCRDAEKGETVTNLNSEPDVALINALQILNAAENVYFSTDASPTVSEKECRGRAIERQKSRYVFVETERITLDDGRESSLTHQYELPLPVKFKLSFLKIRPQWASLTLSERFSMRAGNNATPRTGRRGQHTQYPVKSIVRR